MALPSFRKYDVQARFSVYASLLAILPFLAAAIQCLRRYNHDLRAITYGDEGLFKIGFLACVGASGGLSVLAIILGFNSAGQRRNQESKKSWLGFFVGAALLSLTYVLYYAYKNLRFVQTVTT